MKKVKVGIIGCGTIANTAHIPAYSQNQYAEMAYFCDIIPERADKAAIMNGGKAVYDYKEVLNDPEVEAISVCTPNHFHAQISIDALNAGKHVLCEKPAARTYTEALEMQKAQHASGKTLNIGVVNRFNTAVNKIKNIIDNGELGEVYHVYVSFRAPRSIPGLGGAFTTKAIAGGGALIDWGVHFLDIVMYCCGDPLTKTVSGEIFSKLGKDIDGYTYTSMWAGPPTKGGIYDVEDSMTSMIRTEGPVISVHGAWAQNIGHEEMFIDFMGDKAGIRLKYGADFELFGVKDGMLTATSVQLQKTNHFHNEIDSFIDCVMNGKRNAAHIDTAIITSRMMQAIYDSAETHSEIKF